MGEKHNMRTKALPLFLVLALISCAAAQTTGTAQQKYQPTVGQAGKDVIWVPTSEELVEVMLDMAKVTAADYVIDLGSGDGRIAIAAAKRGARALGIEFNPDMVALSKENAEKAGVSGKATFLNADIFETDFSKATVVTMYLLSSLNLKLRPQILDLKPGTRIVSHAFGMDDWEPDQTSEIDYRVAYLWIVPAKAAGTWTWPAAQDGEAVLSLRQTYQKIEGGLKIGGSEMPLLDAKLEGDRISFSVEDGPGRTRVYSGRVNGGAIQGTVTGAAGAASPWTAKRGN
jgi:SAM-dependent methyltransferase